MKRIELTLRRESDMDSPFFYDEDGGALICQEWADAHGIAGATRIAVNVSLVDNGGIRVRPDPDCENCYVGARERYTSLTYAAYHTLDNFCEEHNTDTVWVSFEVLS